MCYPTHSLPDAALPAVRLSVLASVVAVPSAVAELMAPAAAPSRSHARGLHIIVCNYFVKGFWNAGNLTNIRRIHIIRL